MTINFFILIINMFLVKLSQLNNTKVLSSKPVVKKPDSAIYTTRKHMDLLPPKKKILS